MKKKGKKKVKVKEWREPDVALRGYGPSGVTIKRERDRVLTGTHDSVDGAMFTLRVGNTPYRVWLENLHLQSLRDWLIKVIDKNSDERERESERRLREG